MPAIKSEKCAFVQFGRGDILITKARNHEKSYQDEILLVVDDRENPVGSAISQERWDTEFSGKMSDELNAPVHLAFENIAGLDALLSELLELRAEMATAIPEPAESDYMKMRDGGERFFIGSDESSHKYIVPLSRKADWDAWREIPEDDPRSWDAPEYAEMIEGGRLTFQNWRMD